MIHLSDKLCDYCGTCVGVCPENCIDLGEYRLRIDAKICTECLKCILVCPVEALAQEIKGKRKTG